MEKRALFRVALAAIIPPLACIAVANDATAKPAVKPLVVATLPVESTEVQKGVYKLLSKELAAQLGRPVQFVRPDTYSAVLDGLKRNEIDVAQVGAVVYVKARKNGNVRAILRAVRDGYPDYRGMIVVRADTPYQHPEDLRGKRIAFVDEHSTAGYVFPLRLLREHKLEPGKDFTMELVGGHQKVVEQVAKGQVAAGACFEGAETRLQNPDSVKAIAYTEPVPGDPLVVRKGLDPALISKLTDIFQKLDKLPEGGDFLLFAGIDKFVPTTDKDYDQVAQAVQSN